jgi:hypothetical protein
MQAFGKLTEQKRTVSWLYTLLEDWVYELTKVHVAMFVSQILREKM